jgi:PKD repeat protein
MKRQIFTLALVLAATTIFAAVDKKQVNLRVQTATGNIDEAAVYTDQGISLGFVAVEDAEKVFNAVAGVPNIYTLSNDNYALSSNGFGDFTNTLEVAIGLDVDADGDYTITAPTIDNYDGTSIIRLEDRTLGVFTDLRGGGYTTTIGAADPIEGRFYLHISKAATLTAAAAGCANNDGIISVTQDNTITWDASQVYDSNNNLVADLSNVTGQYDFNSLPEGDYTVVFGLGVYSAQKQIHVEGHQVVSDIIVTDPNALTGEDIFFQSQSVNANSFEWTFGDGSNITGIANPSYAFYTPGTYDVELKATNIYGCEALSNATVYISVASAINDNFDANKVVVLTQGKNLSINTNATADNTTFKLFNLIGEEVYTQPMNSSTFKGSFSELHNGYYIVSLSNGTNKFTKKILLAN